MVALKCAVCSQFKAKLESMRNYCSAFIEGTNNVRTSTFKEHATTDMHARAMALFKKQWSSSVGSVASLTTHQSRGFLPILMDERSKSRTKCKFEIAYTVGEASF